MGLVIGQLAGFALAHCQRKYDKYDYVILSEARAKNLLSGSHKQDSVEILRPTASRLRDISKLL